MGAAPTVRVYITEDPGIAVPLTTWKELLRRPLATGRYTPSATQIWSPDLALARASWRSV